MIVGLIFLYFIGRSFYNLAEKYEKSQWGYAILGIISYYGSLMIYGLVYGMIYYSIYPEELEYETDNFDNDWILMLTGFIFAISVTILTFHLLKRAWKKEKNKDQVSIEDIGKES